MTTTFLNTRISKDKNKIPDTGSLLTTNVLNTKISDVENKISVNSKCITIQEFNKLKSENLAARLKQADLVNKTDFDNKLTSFNKRITSNKAKHLSSKLNSLITKDYFSWVKFIL